MKKLLLSIALALLLIPNLSLAFFETNLKHGSKGEAVIELQDLLVDLGYLNDKIDGRFGLNTRRAVIKFQIANGLKGDGYFGKASRQVANEMLLEILKESNDAEIAETGSIATTKTDCASGDLFSSLTGKSCNPTAETPITPEIPKQPEINTQSQPIPEPVDSTPPLSTIQKVTDLWLSRFGEDGLYFKGTVGLNSSYQDPLPSSGVIKIEFYMDEVMFASLIGDMGPKVGWDTTKYSDGEHTLTQKVYDKAGNVGTASVIVLIKNN